MVMTIFSALSTFVLTRARAVDLKSGGVVRSHAPHVYFSLFCASRIRMNSVIRSWPPASPIKHDHACACLVRVDSGWLCCHVLVAGRCGTGSPTSATAVLPC